MDGLEEKFTRCPQCRSYSIARIPPKISTPFLSRFITHYNSYHCRNCGHNFKQPATESNIFYAEQIHTHRKKTLTQASLLISSLFVIVALLVFLLPQSTQNKEPKEQPNRAVKSRKENVSPGKDVTKQPEQSSLKDPVVSTHPDETAPPVTDKPNNKPQMEASEQHPLTIEASINLAGSNRFGVNWVITEDGLSITRLSEGPLLNAGLLIGDKITHLNGIKIESDKTLMEFRNQLIHGTVLEGLLSIKRNEQTLVFKLTNSTLQKKPIHEQTVIHLFANAPLRIRSSSPLYESSSQRWIFNKKTITLTRKANQKVFISGSSDGLQPWAVDNILLISDKPVPGLSTQTTPDMSFISKEQCQAPFEITEYFPALQPIEMSFALVDLGIKWGNTDIYLIIQQNQ